MEVVAAFRDGEVKTGAEAARAFKCTRVRINQILQDYAPAFLAGKTKAANPAADRVLKRRQAEMVRATAAALKAHPTHAEAAQALGLTASGLYSRMRRLNIPA